ncbi:MAG: diheme cytochrome c [Nitrosomonadales bacterium]|nr:diheme cytochrome c [Nitrosomonadales bacterium]
MYSIDRNTVRMIALIALLAGAVGSVQADDHEGDEHEHGSRVVVSNARWQSECGSCHVAFPPRMLPAASWRAMMAGLDKHFGTDASLEPAVAREIGAFLEKHAGPQKQEPAGKPQLRISELRWFVREHDEVPDRIWKNPQVKSPANCAACHTKAESGDYRERNIRMPGK